MVKFNMVNVMSIVKYPPHIADDLVKFYLSGKATKYPEFVKRVNQWMASDYEYITYNINNLYLGQIINMKYLKKNYMKA